MYQFANCASNTQETLGAVTGFVKVWSVEQCMSDHWWPINIWVKHYIFNEFPSIHPLFCLLCNLMVLRGSALVNLQGT